MLKPTLQHFMIAMQGVEPWSDPDRNRRKPGDLHGILFQNITIAASSVLGEPDVLWGMENGRISNLIMSQSMGKKLRTLIISTIMNLLEIDEIVSIVFIL